VAELADALGSGLSERKLVRVQVPPSASRGTALISKPSFDFCLTSGLIKLGHFERSGKQDSLKGEFSYSTLKNAQINAE